MVKDAEAHASDDKERREGIESRNRLDSLVYQGEKQLAENAEKLSDEDRKGVEEALAEARRALEDQTASAATLDAAYQRVEGGLHRLAETLYKAQAPEGAAAGAEGDAAAGGGEDVIDAEYTEGGEEKSDR